MGHTPGSSLWLLEAAQRLVSTDTPNGSVTSSTGVAGEGFGWSLALSRNLVVIGAPGQIVNGTNSGAAYIYEVQ